MNMSEQDFMNWYWKEATEDEKQLFEKVESFSDYFEDMLFVKGTPSYELTKCKTKDSPDGEWYDVAMSPPEELEYFSYTYFTYKVKPLENCGGYYNHTLQELCLTSEAFDHNETILHEMIHLHESVLNELPLYFHDMIYWALYKDLKDKIPKLDEIITDHAHILTGSSLFSSGGLHDILFLLKSFDLDIRFGYPLGTVFSYGRKDLFKEYQYLKEENQ